MKRLIALLVVTALMLALMAMPAMAAPVFTGGLVNVGIDLDADNVLSQNEVIVAVPVGIAANVCDVNANVLAQQVRNGGASCVADADAIADIKPGPFQPQS